MAIERGQEADPSRDTAGGALLEPVLADKENQALDRTVRLIALPALRAPRQAGRAVEPLPS